MEKSDFGEILNLEQFIKLMSVIKTEQLRKKKEKLQEQGFAEDYPEE